jgi:DNA-binding NarL/FixJ family response regulator
LKPSGLWLTRRERQILVLICRARPNKQIAADLGIATSTVKSHVHALLKKLAEACPAGQEAPGDRKELMVWGAQHPLALLTGHTADVGLHRIGCRCGTSLFCANAGRAELLEAA